MSNQSINDLDAIEETTELMEFKKEIDSEDALAVLNENPIDIAEHAEYTKVVTEEIVDAVRGDRQEAQKIIDYMFSEIQTSINANKRIPSGFVDGLASILSTKASINATAIKAMDMRTKLISAIKGKGVTVNNNNNINNAKLSMNLESILNNSLPVPGE